MALHGEEGTAPEWPVEIKSLLREQLEKQSMRHHLKHGNAYWTSMENKNRRNDDRFNLHWPDDEESLEDDWYTMIKSPMDQLNIFLQALHLKALPLPSFTKIKQINGFTQISLCQY